MMKPQLEYRVTLLAKNGSALNIGAQTTSPARGHREAAIAFAREFALGHERELRLRVECVTLNSPAQVFNLSLDWTAKRETRSTKNKR